MPKADESDFPNAIAKPDGASQSAKRRQLKKQEYVIERGFGRLKGKPLSLSPMYLQRDDHATGLVRLLTLGLRGLTLLATQMVCRPEVARIRTSQSPRWCRQSGRG